VRLSDNGEIIEVMGDHGERSSTESRGSVVHKGAVVVRHAKVGGPAHLVKVVSHVARDWCEVDLDITVTVWAALFVVKSDGVSQLVSDDAWDNAAAGLERHLMRTMVVADAGVAALSAEDGDVVVVSGRASLR